MASHLRGRSRCASESSPFVSSPCGENNSIGQSDGYWTPIGSDDKLPLVVHQQDLDPGDSPSFQESPNPRSRKILDKGKFGDGPSSGVDRYIKQPRISRK